MIFFAFLILLKIILKVTGKTFYFAENICSGILSLCIIHTKNHNISLI
jgi:hypothetical protein